MVNAKGRTVGAFGLVGLLLLPSVATAGTTTIGLLFNEIRSANGDGSAETLILPYYVAEGWDPIAAGGGSVFWVGGYDTAPAPVGAVTWIRRADLAGGNPHDISNGGHWGGIAVDAVNGKIYLTPGSDCAPDCTSIIRANLDGSNVQSLFPAGFPGRIAVHPQQSRVCWADFAFGENFEAGIVCGTVGQPSGTLVVDQPGVIVGVAIDDVNDKLYWTGGTSIRRANLDGSAIEDVVSGLTSLGGIAVDPQGGWIWWTEPNFGRIRRAQLDGSGIVDVVTGQHGPSGISFLPDGATGKIYWMDAEPQIVPATSVWGLLVLALVLGGAGALRVVARSEVPGISR